MEQNTIPLIENKKEYELYISKEVHRKIKEWCYISPDTEWSGTLFYKPEGSFEDDSLKITIIDFLVSDVGTSTYTEYDVKPEVINYMIENNLLDYKMGLIHSHNKMSTFFSGTDINTLKEEGNNISHFVSLIVNNSGPYCARITRKVTEKIKGKLNITYSTFNDAIASFNKDSVDTVKTYIESFNLHINIEEDEKDYLRDSIKKRYDELVSLKKSNFSLPTFNNQNTFPKFNNVTNTAPSKSKDDDFAFPKNIIDAYTGQILSGSITMSAESFNKLDKKEFILERMAQRFENRFGKDTPGITEFSNWMENHIDCIINEASDKSLTLKGLDKYDQISLCAMNIIDEIKSIVGYRTNVYLTEIIGILESYIYVEEEIEKDSFDDNLLFTSKHFE